MAIYRLRNDKVEAFRLGDEIEEDWVEQLFDSGLISQRGVNKDLYDVKTSTGEHDNARTGDYVLYEAPISGEPDAEHPQGELLAPLRLDVLGKDEFEALYELDAPASRPNDLT